MNQQSLSNDYYDDPQTREDYIQIAIDRYGSAVRDNNRSEIYELGKNYHLNGDDE